MTNPEQQPTRLAQVEARVLLALDALNFDSGNYSEVSAVMNQNELDFESGNQQWSENLRRRVAEMRYQEICEHGSRMYADNAAVALKINRYVGRGKTVVGVRPAGARGKEVYKI